MKLLDRDLKNPTAAWLKAFETAYWGFGRSLAFTTGRVNAGVTS